MISLREATKSRAATPLPEAEQDLPPTPSTSMGDDGGRGVLDMDNNHDFDERFKHKKLNGCSTRECRLANPIPICNSFGSTNVSWTEGWIMTDNEHERASWMRAKVSNLIERNCIDDRVTVGLPYNTGTGICFGSRTSKLGMMTWRESSHGDILVQYSYEEGRHIARRVSIGNVDQDGSSEVLDDLRAVKHLRNHAIEEQLGMSEKDECSSDCARNASYHQSILSSGKLRSIDETIDTDGKYLPITTALLTLRQRGANDCEWIDTELDYAQEKIMTAMLNMYKSWHGLSTLDDLKLVFSSSDRPSPPPVFVESLKSDAKLSSVAIQVHGGVFPGLDSRIDAAVQAAAAAKRIKRNQEYLWGGMNYVAYASVLDILLVCRTMDLRTEGGDPNICKSIEINPLTECNSVNLEANKNKPRPAKKNSWYESMAKVSMDWLDRFTGGTGAWAHPVVDVAVMPVLLSVGLVRGFNFGIQAGEAWIVGTAVDYYRLLVRQPPTEVKKLLKRSLELLTHEGSYFDEYDRVGLDRIIDLVSSCEVNCHTECLIQSNARDVSMWQQVDTWDGELCRLLDFGTGSFGYWALKGIQSNAGADCSYEEYMISVCCAYIHDIIDYRADFMDGDKINLVIQLTDKSDAEGPIECCGYIKAYIDDDVVASKDGVLIGKVSVLGFLAWNMTCLRYGALERIFQCAMEDSRKYDSVTLLRAVKMEAQNICGAQDGDGAREGTEDAVTDWQEMISSGTQQAAHALVCERLYMWPGAERKGMHKYCMGYFATLGLIMLRNDLLELCCSEECLDFHEMDKEVA